LKQKDHRI